MSAFDVSVPQIISFSVLEPDLLSVEALADAAARLPPEFVEHHHGDLPRLLPDGTRRVLPLTVEDVIRTIAVNECWVMVNSLASLPEYQPVLLHVGAPLQLALRAHGETPTGHDLIAFIAAPHAAVPLHFDANHHLLIQIQGTKTVGIGYFDNPRERKRQIERGLLEYRLNADMPPDRSEEFTLRPGQALVIPAYAFHWVEGHDNVSVALTYTASTDETTRAKAEFRGGARRATS